MSAAGIDNKPTQRYRVALVGCGPRGRDHAKAFVKLTDRFELVAVCDRNPGNLEAFSRVLCIPATYTCAERMLSKERPEVLCFATRPQVRLELVQLGIQYGVTAIAFEKPMATSLAEARRIRDLCREAGVRAVVSHQHKYGCHWREVRAIIEAGQIGVLHTIHATAKGALLEYGTHLVDCMMFLNGGRRGRWVLGCVDGRNKLVDTHPSPDYVLGQIEFENGVRGIVECGVLAPDQPGENAFWMNAGAAAYGSEGCARVVVGSGWQAQTRSSRGVIRGPGGFDVDADQPAYIADLARWLDDPACVHPCSVETAYHGFELMMGICLSSLERRKISVPVDSAEPVIERLRREL
ncbi:MAG: Gfo/Idh/MocA family oxidoreductase [Kiritimatiellae bacterium]|nr:Gfo/Idh/MocA family oxidoreductase [Kiritimatiellia bacterium]